MPESLIAIMAESLPTHFLRTEFNSRALELKRTSINSGAFARAIMGISEHSLGIKNVPDNKINELIFEIISLLDGYYGQVVEDDGIYYFEEL